MVNIKNEFDSSILKPPANVTGKEKAFLIQIINLSTKTKATDILYAKKSLKNQHFIINSCKALKGFHTHNPKIYDAKVKGRIFAKIPKFIQDTPYIYSDSIRYHHHYSSAGNAKYISCCYFLCTEFLYQGHHTTLYHEFLKDTSDLVAILIKMGLTQKHSEIIKSACRQHSQNPFPESVPPYQVQVLVPSFDDHEYISVSPISSSSVQAAVHNFCWSDDVYPIGRSFHNLLRPENIGALATAARGSIAVLSPELNLKNIAQLSVSQITAYLSDHDNLLFTGGLDFRYFLKVRKTADFSTNRYTPNPKSPQKTGILNRIQKSVALLFSRLDALRSAYQEGTVDELSIKRLILSQRSYVKESKLSESEMKGSLETG